jgi:UDP-N-acetylmuramoyl-L-alanyl-D-glutamate--2,6-diaminopimelate ligase
MSIFLWDRTMNLCDLLKDYVPLNAAVTPLISGLANDSRKVKSGDVFFAYPGFTVDGRDYIADAIKRGAVAVLYESDGVSEMQQSVIGDLSKSHDNISIVSLPNLRKVIGLIAAKFYNYPARAMTMIGVTGTNGKTSCTQFIADTLQQLGCPCGVIGTLGVGFPHHLSELNNTTPDALTLQQQLAQLRDGGARAVAMEVSSHALAEERVAGIEFSTAVFTNLTRDHLDYHGDMEKYAAAKRLLFQQATLKSVVLNIDDAFGRDLWQMLELRQKQLPSQQPVRLYGYSTHPDAVAGEFKKHTLCAQQIVANIKGIRALLETPWGNVKLHSRLLGHFNLDNLLAVIAVLCDLGFPLTEVLSRVSLLPSPPGRMETFGGGNKPLAVIDYAHTPDALEKVLLVLREHCAGSLWCVFGCGGDRDRGKRPLMGQIAERYSDHVIITDDNPRTENPQQIVDDITRGLLCAWAVEVEHDRGAAIAHALECAQSGDIVLIAGKGHENYQVVGKDKIYFSDIEVVKTVLNLRGGGNG